MEAELISDRLLSAISQWMQEWDSQVDHQTNKAAHMWNKCVSTSVGRNASSQRIGSAVALNAFFNP